MAGDDSDEDEKLSLAQSRVVSGVPRDLFAEYVALAQEFARVTRVLEEKSDESS